MQVLVILLQMCNKFINSKLHNAPKPSQIQIFIKKSPTQHFIQRILVRMPQERSRLAFKVHHLGFPYVPIIKMCAMLLLLQIHSGKFASRYLKSNILNPKLTSPGSKTIHYEPTNPEFP